MEGDDAIAIVAIGCKFPGANNVEEYWDLLLNGKCHVKDIPKERFNTDAIYDKDPSAPGKSYATGAGLIERPFKWEHEQFGYNEDEAAAMDPQQRYVLECVDMALVDGGMTEKDLAGTKTAVYIGAMNTDYKFATTDDDALLTNFAVTGTAMSILSARVSYHYNLLGPAITIDTACSSALVAIHLGAESIKSGESTMAICGGVNSILYRDMFISLCRARMASPSGQCRAFSAEADGYTRGEGCGIVILEKVCDAKRNGHTIWGRIQTGCNQDGKTATPMTAPSKVQQTKLMQEIYERFQIDASSIQYIEAHGTGTPVGDPIEVNSLGEFFMPHTVRTPIHDQHRLIGSVKTNIGHLESAAGVASLIKILLMMKHEKVVPSLHCEKLNPNIAFAEFRFHVPERCYTWHVQENAFRMACVNCFGFGGTNCHAVVKQYLNELSPMKFDKCSFKHPFIVTFSAKTAALLTEVLKQFQISREERQTLKDISYTSLLQQHHFRYRIGFSVNDYDELLKKCSEASHILTSDAKPTPIKKHICFVLCGVGTAWQGMCREMMSNLVFKEAIINIDTHFKQLASWSIEETFSDGRDIKDPFVGHIATFACQIGLAKVWEDLGLVPDAVTGQSVGEVAAAYLAGYLSLKDAVLVIYKRSLLLSKVKEGKMMVVQNCKVELVKEVCSELKSGRLNIAVFSSPEACTVTGDEKAMDELKLTLKQQQLDRLRFKHLDVNCAYHSHFVETAASKLTREVSEICVQKPKIELFSTVTGEKANDLFATPNYWSENTRAEVKMYHALQAMAKDRHKNIFIEVGPKPVVEVHLSNIFPNKAFSVFSSMRDSKEFLTFYESVVSVYQLGVNFKWKALAPRDGCIVEIPQAKTYTKDLKTESIYVQKKCQGSTEQLTSVALLKRTKLPDTFSVTITPHLTPFIYHHIIDGAVVVPGSVYAEIGLELGIILLSATKDKLEVSCDMMHFVSLSKDESCALEIISNQQANIKHCINFSVKHNNKVAAQGFVKKTEHTFRAKHIPFSQIIENCHNNIETSYIYDELKRSGYTYESPNQLFYNLMYNDTENISELRLTKDVQDQLNEYIFHPAIMDAMFHPMLLLFLRNCANPGSTQIFPVKIGSLTVRSYFENRMICYTRKIQEKDNRVVTNFLLINEDGYVVAELKNVEHEIIDGSLTLRSIMHDVSWTEFDIETLDDEKNVNEDDLLIIFPREKEVKTLKIIFPKATFLSVHCNMEDENSLLETKNKLKATMQSKVKVVIFGAGIEHGIEKPNEVFDATRSNCHLLLSVIRAVSKFPLIVFTERTQTVQGCAEMKKREPNVYGAELWGFTRSARLDTANPIMLVDLQLLSKKEQENLKLFVINIDNLLTNTNQFDFVFSDEKIFSCEYFKKKTNVIQCDQRDVKLYSFQEAVTELRSSNPNALENPFLISTSARMLTKHTIQITAVSHIEVLAPQNDICCQIWPECEETGYPVLAHEHYGELSGATSKDSSRRKKVVASFPALCCSEVEIPQECIITLDESTVYKPGVLTPFVFGWYLSENVKSKSVCIICSDTSLCPEAITLKAILESRHITTCTMSPMQVINTSCGKVNTVVLLTNKLLQKVFNKMEHVQNVVGFQDIISETIPKSLYAQKRETRVRILQKSDAFELRFLKACLPKIHKFMKKCPIVTETVSKCVQKEQVIFFQGNDDMVNQNHSIKMHLKPEDIIKHDATYIVVGGLTGLGWEVVKWLANMGAGNVITLSRKLPDNEALSKIKNIMLLHKITIRHEQCDICHLDSFKKLVRRLPSGSLKGIFHGAAILEDCHIDKMTREKIDNVLRPKVLGTLNLHIATKHLDLDLFVLHSSISSLLGNFGQTNYSAANAFLDTFAFFRRFHNLPCQLINWGALDVGLVGNSMEIKDQLRQMGHTPLDNKTISISLSDAITRFEEQMIYAHFDASKSAFTFQTQRQQQQKSEKNMSNTNELFSQLEFSENVSDEKLQTVHSIVLSAVSEVISMSKFDIECNQSLISQGIDSQQAVLLSQKIQMKTGCKLIVPHLLQPEYTVESIVKFVASQKMENRENVQQTVNVTQTVTHFEKIISDLSHENTSFTVKFILKERFSKQDMWENILRHLILKFPELRSQVMENENHFFKMEKKVNNPEDAPVTLTWHDCNRFAFTDPPLKMFFLEEDKTTYLKLVFNPVMLDLESISLVVSEMYNLAKLLIDNGSFPELKVLKTQNQVGIVKRKLDDSINRLETFWISHMMPIQEETEISDEAGNTIPKEFTYTKILLDFTVQKLKKLNIDESNLLCCLYGLVLSKLKSLPYVPIIVCTNVRRHLPEIADRVFMGDNFIPVILRYPDDSTLESSAMSNLHECKNSSLYPYELLRQLDCFRKQSFRHQFRANVLSWPIDGWPNTVFAKAEVLSNASSVYEMDTRLTMIKYEHSGKIELCFSCNENFMDEHLAASVMYHLEHLVLEFLENRLTLCKDYCLQREHGRNV